ncbi:MAG: hypothetical protein Q4B73_06305 [Lachnospiraceae bacterium]|nr:hypothetical protein [Lachnospiraceae bacterium]
MMTFQAQLNGQDVSVKIEKEGLTVNGRCLNYADIKTMAPNNHRVVITLFSDDTLTFGMLGYNFDSFWQELLKAFEQRCLDALFIEEAVVMACEGEYHLPKESGRGPIRLYPDALCILPPSAGSVRLAFSEVSDLTADGYNLTITMTSGKTYSVGKMGYDSMPFFERAASLWKKTLTARQKALAPYIPEAPFTHVGLFRTGHPEHHWAAAITDGKCALELYTGQDAATYLYCFEEPQAVFRRNLTEALEAMSTHREIIYMPDEELAENPLYRMAVRRSEAVCFLRSKFNGRLIHSANHAARLQEFLNA